MEPLLYNGFNFRLPLLGKQNILWKDYMFWRLVLRGYFLQFSKILSKRLAIPTALSLFISFNNFGANSSMTFQKLYLLGSRSKIFDSN